MDGALQTVAGLMASQAENQAVSQVKTREKTSLLSIFPLLWERCEIISPLLPEAGYAYVTAAEDLPAKDLPAKDLSAKDLPAENQPLCTVRR